MLLLLLMVVNGVVSTVCVCACNLQHPTNTTKRRRARPQNTSFLCTVLSGSNRGVSVERGETCENHSFRAIFICIY